MKSQNRQAMSGLIVTGLIIGISVALAGIFLSFGTDWTETMMSIDSIEIQKATLQNSGEFTYALITVKNSGNSAITDMQVTIIIGDEELEPIDFNPTTVNTGSITSVRSSLEDANGDNYQVLAGEEVLMEISGETSNGGTVIETLTVRAT